MPTLFEKCNSTICQWTVNIFGSLNKAAVTSAYFCGLSALMLVGFLTDPHYWYTFRSIIVPRLLNFTLLSNFTLIFGIGIGRLDFIKAFHIVSPVIALSNFVAFIVNILCGDVYYGITAVIFGVITTVQWVIVQEIMNKMATEEVNNKTPNDAWINQNLSLQNKDQVKDTSNLPAMFSM